MTVDVEHVTFAYRRSPVLCEVTARANGGTITAVLGPNAAGKSTLLKCIIGALRPQGGRVTAHGLDVHSVVARRLARHIAYVPQRSVVSAAFTVQQVVELGRYALPPDPQKVARAIEALDLRGLEHRPYRELSVGQQQRVTLARAVAQLANDGVLILDEPASAMDLRHVASCMRLLRQLANGGATIIIAMHDLPLAATIADAMWLLNDGRVEAAGPAHEVMRIDLLQQVFGVAFRWIDLPDGRHLVHEHGLAG